MPQKLLRLVLALMLAALWPAGVSGARADWPEQPLLVITTARPIPRWPALDDPDMIMLEALLPEMRSALGVPVNPRHRPGGFGVGAAGALAEGPANGSVIGLLPLEAVVTREVDGRTPYTMKELRPLALAWRLPLCVAAGPETPYDNLADLRERAGKRPPALAVSGGTDHGLTLPYLLADSLAREGRFEWRAVEPAVYDLGALLNGEAEVMITPLFEVIKHPASHQFKILAVDEPEPVPGFTQYATIRQQGFQSHFPNWRIFYLPRQTPEPLAAQAGLKMAEILQSPNLSRLKGEIGLTGAPRSAAEAELWLAAEHSRQAGLAKDLYPLDH